MIFTILCVIGAYLIGSIPSSLWLGKLFCGIDVRDYGSGNAGATNTFRVLGKWIGFPVLFIDVIKGYLPVFLVTVVSTFDAGSVEMVNHQLIAGIAAVLGHVFPVYAGFRGGKGIATLLGVLLAVHLQASLVSLGIFTVMFLLTGYVSLGSLSAAFLFPVVMVLIFKEQTPSLVYFSLSIAVIVLLTHQKNIERLLRREENKMHVLRLRGHK